MQNGAENVTASFGYEDVPREQKTARVQDVFDQVAGRYDLMNDLMSAGIHRLWKRTMVDLLRPRPGERIVDVAGGTGDIAALIRAATAAEADVVVCDINPSMVEIGRDGAIDRGLIGGIEWLVGNAEQLPLADRSVDAYTIAFGIRNVTDVPAALSEAHRVLKPGGRLVCLEFGHVVVPLLARLYDAYSFRLLPALGRLVAGNAEAYRYLVESIRRFPAPEVFAGMIADSGLQRVRCRNLTGGVAALYHAWRI